MPKTVVLSLGGSLIVPDKIDIDFLKEFKKTIDRYIENDHKFAIICGGGKIARDVQQAASEILKIGNEDLDWLGIYATRLNAKLISTIFRNESKGEVIDDPNEKIAFGRSVIVAAGWLPGRSTDYDAVIIAKNLGIREVINMSNVDYVYDKDPKKYKDAKRIEKAGWEDFGRLMAQKWEAGMNAPFDPVAAKEAKKSGIRVFIIGKDLKNLENLLDGKKFKGTAIG